MLHCGVVFFFFYFGEETITALPETEPRTAQHVASRYTDYAIPAAWMNNIKMDYKK
jgi:hypothetical protein